MASLFCSHHISASLLLRTFSNAIQCEVIAIDLRVYIDLCMWFPAVLAISASFLIAKTCSNSQVYTVTWELLPRNMIHPLLTDHMLRRHPSSFNVTWNLPSHKMRTGMWHILFDTTQLHEIWGNVLLKNSPNVTNIKAESSGKFSVRVDLSTPVFLAVQKISCFAEMVSWKRFRRQGSTTIEHHKERLPWLPLWDINTWGQAICSM